MCGIIAVILADPSQSAVTDIHNGLPVLQHRGQDACGIATCGQGGRIYTRKGNGLCSEVFRTPEQLMDLPGSMGLGHCKFLHIQSFTDRLSFHYVPTPRLLFSHLGRCAIRYNRSSMRKSALIIK